MKVTDPVWACCTERRQSHQPRTFLVPGGLGLRGELLEARDLVSDELLASLIALCL
jgi:hypothetical protein